MRTQRTFGRLLTAAALGLGSLAACAGAASPPPGANDGWVSAPSSSGDPDAIQEAKRAEAEREKNKGAAGPPQCPYGELSDPHRGFIRCLLPDERDARWLPPPPQKAPGPEPPKGAPPPSTPAPSAPAPSAPPPSAPVPSATAPSVTPSAPPSAPPAPPAAVPVVEVGAPKFENGEVPKAEKSIQGLAAEIGKCIADHGGLSGPTGTLKVQFLVRARGRAEGVEVPSVKGISAEAAGCVRVLLKNKTVGAPTSDPVGVTFTIALKAAAK